MHMAHESGRFPDLKGCDEPFTLIESLGRASKVDGMATDYDKAGLGKEWFANSKSIVVIRDGCHRIYRQMK